MSVAKAAGKTAAATVNAPVKTSTKASQARAASTVEEPVARYEQVKDYVRSRVQSGEWAAGQRIPSENALVDLVGVSRMTVNRAIRELTAEGMLTRLAAVGTFVAEAKPQSTLLMIAHIGDEIRARGHEYSYEVIYAGRETAPAVVSSSMNLAPGASVLRVLCLHRENGVPVQLEDRYVNPAIAEDFLEQDFSKILPSQYLLRNHPQYEVEHIVDASMPTRREAELLEIEGTEPCLVLLRRTWTAEKLAVTYARFIHPGSRYRLGCRFSGDARGEQA